MNHSLALFILIPLAGLIATAFSKNNQEKLIFWIALSAILAPFLVGILSTVQYFMGGMVPISQSGLELYKNDSASIDVRFFFDLTSIFFGFVSSALFFMVSIFSRYYMHREKGFKRFFGNMLLFNMGVSFIIFSGNFETLLIGWEIIGISSFFLIAFYRDRYLPVKNALKVISLYRLADIFLMLALWLCHHSFHKSISFDELNSVFIAQHGGSLAMTWGIPFCFIVVAAIKSAQFPFSSWLPRAMEGPTTSSAIFYGALSVHMGVFLLIRTYVFWQNNLTIHASIIALGLITGVVATLISRVQSSVKSQIAYSSIAQIGIMFIEIGLGWHLFALFHFAANAFLRSYQLLVSPSVLHYLIHDQFYHFKPKQHTVQNTLIGRLKLSLYMLSIKEFNLDSMMFSLLWNPLKTAGNAIRKIDIRLLFGIFGVVYLVGLCFVYNQEQVGDSFLDQLPKVFAGLGLILSLRAFVELKNAQTAWLLLFLNQLYTSLSIAFNEDFEYSQIHLFLSGIFVFGAIGSLCINRLRTSSEKTTLTRFHGHAYEHPRLATVFLVSCMVLIGFPISPTFIGEDLILGHIHPDEIWLISLTALNLILNGLVAYRLYARLFLGPHTKGYHEVAYRSS
jgi:NADH-quinone oxidoreductase subunit L